LKIFEKWIDEYELKFVLQEDSELDSYFKLAAKFHQGAARRMKKRLRGEEGEYEYELEDKK
jgi:hypothetical protein